MGTAPRGISRRSRSEVSERGRGDSEACRPPPDYGDTGTEGGIPEQNHGAVRGFPKTLSGFAGTAMSCQYWRFVSIDPLKPDA